MAPPSKPQLYRFLKLPLELRQEIYKHLFPYSQSHALGLTHSDIFGDVTETRAALSTHPLKGLHTNILRTND